MDNKENKRSRSLKFKILIKSLLAVVTTFVLPVAVYYTVPYSTSSENYNFTKNDHLFKFVSTPMELPIKWIFLVVDDCRAEAECNEIVNNTVSN